MDTITIDFSKSVGQMKPMHSVNNGPVYRPGAKSQDVSNVDHFLAAGIPYARNHDASSYVAYGGEHIVDVNMIFTDFDADPTLPESYDFTLTDYYLQAIEAGGSKVFYRLGSRIEHWPKKYNTLPPKDYHKWAVICEHIIRHYTEGWADGFHMDIEYWEIWNEPNLDPDDSPNKRNWGGTAAEFYEFYCVAHKHLKACFPHLKIGGPSCSGLREEWLKGFFAKLQENDIRPDFFSWHGYAYTVESFRDRIRAARKGLDGYGLLQTENILNEWNYIKGWRGEDWKLSLKTEKSMKGAAFIAAVMAMAQYEPLDNLMFYDARPGGMNSLFDTDIISERLKGYYPFYMFNRLYRLGSAVPVLHEAESLWAVAAKGEEQNAMIVYYNDDTLPEKTVKVSFQNVANENGVRLEYYLLDETHDCALVREEIFTAKDFAAYVKMPLNSVYLLKIVNL